MISRVSQFPKARTRRARERTWRRIFCFSDRRRKSRAKSVGCDTRNSLESRGITHAAPRNTRPLIDGGEKCVSAACVRACLPLSPSLPLSLSLCLLSRSLACTGGLSDVALAVSLQIGEPLTSSVYFESQIIARGRLSWTIGRPCFALPVPGIGPLAEK